MRAKWTDFERRMTAQHSPLDLIYFRETSQSPKRRMGKRSLVTARCDTDRVFRKTRAKFSRLVTCIYSFYKLSGKMHRCVMKTVKTHTNQTIYVF
jgi:hypothetical protein